MRKGPGSAYDKLQIQVQYTITCRLNTDPELPVTRLGEPWTHHFCIGITFFANNKMGCTSGTHDVLVGTHQNVILQGALLIYHNNVNVFC